jgi:ABC-2 type transport system ATP-binding protein
MGAQSGALVDVRDVRRRFGERWALDGVSLELPARSVHALLGRNGAGKTTLLRILTGLVAPSGGIARIGGLDVTGSPRAIRRSIGLVPSGDRTFYLRLTGLENLVFFARLRGFRLRESRRRARLALAQVGLEDAAAQTVGTYSHGMQKRLSIARGVLHDPPVLLVDEATHDLDPEGSRAIRALVRGAADRGAAVLWATQRVDEIDGLADRVTLLDAGRVRFEGTVAELRERTPADRYVLGVRNGLPAGPTEELLQQRLGGIATIRQRPGFADFVVMLAGDAVIGDALRALLDADIAVISCRQEVSTVEDAYVNLLQEPPS